MDNRESVCTYTKTTNTCKPGKIAWNVFFLSMAETSPNTPTTPHSQDSTKSTTGYPAPEARTFQLDCGSIRVEVGEFWKVVSSWHLVDVAENQLIKSWRDHHR
jgi:hypothetical protein